MPNPIAYFQDGNIHVRQLDGSYKVDPTPWWCLVTLDALKSLPLELRSKQDNQSIDDLQAMFRARRDWEEEKNGRWSSEFVPENDSAPSVEGCS